MPAGRTLFRMKIFCSGSNANLLRLFLGVSTTTCRRWPFLSRGARRTGSASAFIVPPLVKNGRWLQEKRPPEVATPHSLRGGILAERCRGAAFSKCRTSLVLTAWTMQQEFFSLIKKIAESIHLLFMLLN